jgi:hypothetical protein
MLRRNGPDGSNQVVDVHVPQRGAILCLVFAEEPLKLTQARHLDAAKTEPARYLGEVASAVGSMHGVDAIGSEFMRLGTLATVIDDADQ